MTLSFRLAAGLFLVALATCPIAAQHSQTPDDVPSFSTDDVPTPPSSPGPREGSAEPNGSSPDGTVSSEAAAIVRAFEAGSPIRFAVTFEIDEAGNPREFKLVKGTGAREVDDAVSSRLAQLQTSVKLGGLRDCADHRMDFAITRQRVALVISGLAPSDARAHQIAEEARRTLGAERSALAARVGEGADAAAWTEGRKFYLRVTFPNPSGRF